MVLADMSKNLEEKLMELDGQNIFPRLKVVLKDVQNFPNAGHSIIMEIQTQKLTRIVTFKSLVKSGHN